MTRVTAFGWYGGKFSHLSWLLPLLPTCTHYCEPFGGSAAVLLNRPPSAVETYNDTDGDVVGFFQVLRDQTEDLIKAISLTPFSRAEYDLASEPTDDPIERARRFYVRARQSWDGLAQTATSGRWAYCRLSSRSGMANNVSRWLGSVEGLTPIAERLLRVQIEHGPALDVIRRCDSPQTLFYCDPPYSYQTRGPATTGSLRAYAYEMSDEEHRELANVLNDVQGKVALSGYEHHMMDKLYPPSRWRVVKAPERHRPTNKKVKAECLWTNYDPTSMEGRGLDRFFED